MQTIKDLPFQLKHCYLVLKKRRYTCPCGKRFFEDYSFLPRYFQRTSRLTAFIAAALHDTASVSSIAERCNVSVSTVNRILDTISFHRPTSPAPFLLMNSKEMQVEKNISVFWWTRSNTLSLIFYLLARRRF